MNIRNNISYRNRDSSESSLFVKYKFKEGTKTIEVNRYNTPNNILPRIEKNKCINRSNKMREQHFNSYTNENMDFFRLDYLKECDRDHYHNKYLINVTPINRNENFDSYNENRKKIRYIDSLKKNGFLNRQNNYRNIIEENLFTSENILKNNYYKKRNNMNILTEKNNNRYEANITDIDDTKMDRNITIDNRQSFSGAYLSNINDYSIKENHMNPRKDIKNNIIKRSILSKQSHLFCKDVINNDMPALFYKIYDYNINNNGFKKQNDIFSNYAQNASKPGYIKRDMEQNIYHSKGSITPFKKINFNNNNYFFSYKK